ncbi:MAG: oligosaccharide flippase family protein [Actinobacteria bacterium]|nr:oligosaccharide flippase family protein [Actinomycetota bacterium]
MISPLGTSPFGAKDRSVLPQGECCDGLHASSVKSSRHGSEVQSKHRASLQKAKQVLIRNVASNYAVLITTSVVSFLLTPYFISRLGIAAYGMIGLANTCVFYLSILPNSLASSLFRFLSMKHHSNPEEAERYYNTCTLAAFGFALLGVVPGVILAWATPFLFQIPMGLTKSTRILFLLTIMGGLVGVSVSSFQTHFFLLHRQWQRNFTVVVSRIFAVAALLGSFWYFGSSLAYVGVYQLMVLALPGLLAALICIRSGSSMRLRRGSFSFPHLRTVFSYASKLLLFDLANSLPISGTFIVVNRTAGAEWTGSISPFMQVMLLFQMLAQAVTNVIRSVIFEYIGHGEASMLTMRTMQATRLLGLGFGLALVGLSGVSHVFLQVWLGEEFAVHSLLPVEMAAAAYLGTVLSIPYRQVLRGKYTQGFALTFSIGVGVIHLLGVYSVFQFSDCKMEAFGLVFLLVMGVIRAVGQGLHCDKLFGLHYGDTFRRTHMCYWLPLCIAAGLVWLVSGRSPMETIAFTLGAVICYGILGFKILLLTEDRRLLLSLLHRKRP